MAPMFGEPNYSFLLEDKAYDSVEIDDKNNISPDENLTQMAFWYMVVLVVMLITWLLVFFCLRMVTLRQKTRTPQQRRRMYAGQRSASLTAPEPTVYVSPANLPPPPKYEALAPPSYEEVVGIHYPQYSVQQPITAPIAAALGQSSTNNVTNTATSTSNVQSTTSNPVNSGASPSTDTTVVVIAAEERRTSVTVARH